MYCYVHIPFCRQKCTYCKFALTPFVREHQIGRYLESLGREIKNFFHDEANNGGIASPIESLYFGGGTPSVLSPEQIGRVFARFPSDRFTREIEITLEANPEDITEEWASGVRALGVNRISLGVQTMIPESLARIWRGGGPEIILSALSRLRDARHDNVNVDFILGLPFVPFGATLDGIRLLHESFPNIRHTSVYFLEKGVYPKDWGESSISEEEAREEYAWIREYLLARGLNHYEISNFWTPGYESRHNRAYWTHQNVRGFWMAAASYMDRRRFENASTFSGYYRGEMVGEEYLTSDQLRIERGMFGLRTFSFDPHDCIHPERISSFIEDGYMVEVDGKISVTPPWIFIIDHIMGELL